MPRRGLMRSLGAFAAIMTAICLATPAHAVGFPKRCADVNRRVSVYAFPWSGDQALGRTVASILSMQIWRTLRRSDPDRPRSDFGCGLVERISPGAPLYSNIQVKGAVQKIGPDAVVQATLALVPRNDHRPKPAESWTVTYGGKSVSFNPVKKLYVFAPFPLRGDILKQYPSLRGIRLCRGPRLPCNGGTIGVSDLDAVSQQGDFAYVNLGDGRRGWIYLPSLSDRSEMVDFVCAIMRLQRGDYGGAVELLQPIQSTIATTSIRVDALVIQAVARELLGQSGAEAIAAAKALNPALKSVGQVQIMQSLAAAAKEGNADRRRDIARNAKELVGSLAKLFDPADPWPRDVSALADALEAH